MEESPKTVFNRRQRR